MEAPPEDMGSEPGTGGTAETSTQEAGLSSFREALAVLQEGQGPGEWRDCESTRRQVVLTVFQRHCVLGLGAKYGKIKEYVKKVIVDKTDKQSNHSNFLAALKTWMGEHNQNPDMTRLKDKDAVMKAHATLTTSKTMGSRLKTPKRLFILKEDWNEQKYGPLPLEYIQGPLTSPSAAAVRIASHMVPKGKGGKGKGKNKSSKGRGKPPLAAPVARQALPTGGVAFSRNTPIGSVYGTPRALTVYGVRTASTPAFTTPTPRLGSRPPGRPVASLQKDRPALRGRGMDRGRGRGAPAHGPIGRGHVTLTSAPNRRRSRSASRRRPEAQGRRRSRSHGHGGHGHGSRRSRSRSRRRGRKP
eukprot:symbB.v1.2.012037.t1/scaffold756.1/size166813/7